MSDIVYEDLDADGNMVTGKSMSEAAREPKTKLEKEFIALFPGTRRFANRKLHESFKKWQVMATKGTDDAILRLGYFKSDGFSGWIQGKNRNGRVIIGQTTAIAMLLSEDRFIEWRASAKAQEFLKQHKRSAPGQAVRQVGRELEEE